jgi:hypothetical protein
LSNNHGEAVRPSQGEDCVSITFPTNKSEPIEQMQTMLAGHFVAQCLHVVAVLGIADLIVKGHKTIEQLASAADCNASSLNRLLCTLSSMNVFTCDAAGHFGLTPLGETLRSDVQGSLRDKALFEISQPMWSAWGSCLDCVRTGRPSFDQVHGAALWQYLADHSDIAAIFNRFMTVQSRLHNAAIIDSYNFSAVGVVVDIGGGQGGTLAAVLTQYPDMRGVLFDLPNVVAPASKLETSRFLDRCEVVGGDMLQSVPRGGDVYIIKRVMMDLTDEDAIRVLGNCIAAMKRDSKILIVDPVLPDGNEPHPNRLVDLHMMNVTGGQCRTEAQFRKLYETSGLRLTRTVATRSPNFILEGSRP